MTLAPRLALITIAGTLALLGLAIMFCGTNLSSGEHEDRANRWVLIAFVVLGVLDAWLPAYTDRKGLWTIDGVHRWRRAAAMAGVCPRPSVQWTGRDPARA